MKRLLYTTRRTLALAQFAAGLAVRNPKFYEKPESGVTEVGIEGDYPQIVSDYEALGVQVFTDAGERSSEGNDPDSDAQETQLNDGSSPQTELVADPEPVDGEPGQEDATERLDTLPDAEQRKLLIAELKEKGIKHAKNAPTDELRALTITPPAV